MMATYREEQAARLSGELEKPFKATHAYQPGVLDLTSPTVVAGSAIERGAPVQVLREHTRAVGAGVKGWGRHFKVVRDVAGNRQHVMVQGLGRLDPDVFHDRRIGEIEEAAEARSRGLSVREHRERGGS
jgi:hypothetical protein